MSANTVLIVDDSEMNRDILTAVFTGTHSIETAENGREGLEKLWANRPQICAILLDVVMPVMGGMEVLETLAEKQVVNDIPVFLITGEKDDKIVKHAYELGVMDVIPKPISPYVVLRRVNSIIELFAARKRLARVVNRQKGMIEEQAGQIVKLNMGMIEALASAIEFRSGESGNHVRRIHDITELFLYNSPLRNDFSSEEIKYISLAAIMHDVGKLSISDTILNKPGRLTPEEFEIMKTHTTLGRRLLEAIPQMRELPFFRYACDIALHHHERWDGRGYPEGLKGDEISLWAQIVSIADVYDALVSPRCYKKAFSFDKALGMILNGECGTFNPLLLRYLQEIEGDIRLFYRDRHLDGEE